MAAKRRGAPGKFTPETCKKILDAVRKGNYRNISAQFAGITPNTLISWLRRGEQEKTGEYADFRYALLEAEMEAEIKAVDSVLKDPDVRHKEWWLERKFPERWGKDRDLLRELVKRIRELEKRSGVDAGEKTAASDKTPGSNEP